MKALMILLLFCVLNLGNYLYFRRKFVMFSQEILWNTRRIMGNKTIVGIANLSERWEPEPR